MKQNLSRVLKRKLPALKRLFASDPRVLGVFLFGSQADGTATPRSDIDLAVLFEREISLDEQLTFEVAVCDVLGVYDDVDIVNLNRASLPFRFRALSGKLLYERDDVRVSDFIEETIIEQRDYNWFMLRFNEDYLVGLRRKYAQFRQRKDHRAHQDNRNQSARTRNATWQVVRGF